MLPDEVHRCLAAVLADILLLRVGRASRSPGGDDEDEGCCGSHDKAPIKVKVKQD